MVGRAAVLALVPGGKGQGRRGGMKGQEGEGRGRE